MILVDANLLLYAYNTSASENGRARDWLEESLSSVELFGLSWQSIVAFIRIGSNPRVFARPFSIAEASRIVASWVERPMVRILTPGERHWEILQRLLIDGQAIAGLASDAHLAALAIEHGAVLYTTDKDFSRFPGLRTRNPLAC